MRNPLLTVILLVTALTGCNSTGRQLSDYHKNSAFCHDRHRGSQLAAVDTHIHFKPFGGQAIPFAQVTDYLKRADIQFANVYGIGQTFAPDSGCVRFSQCPDSPITPTQASDLQNAEDLLANPPQGIVLTLSMTFMDLAKPQSTLSQMQALDARYPNLFKWAGEVNLVKQALYSHGHQATPIEAIERWAPFMTWLRKRNIPLAIHADLGNDEQPLRYKHLMEAVLDRYPDNHIVWMHMGLSKEQLRLPVQQHLAVMEQFLTRFPKLMLDVSWRLLADYYFADYEARQQYVAFFNRHARRILPGSDFVASKGLSYKHYRNSHKATGEVFRHLDDNAFRAIALGQNYLDLLGVSEYRAPPICR